MTGTNSDLFTHNQSRSYLNHLVHSYEMCGINNATECNNSEDLNH
jgi:hypothetical protein